MKYNRNMSLKRVSKKYARNEFQIIGMALIIYCLFALFIPLLLDELFAIYEIDKTKTFDIPCFSKIIIITIGTILPFKVIELAGRGKKRVKNRVKISLREIVIESLLFFTICSIALFIITSFTTYFSIPGEVVTSIGMPLNSDRLNDFAYVSMFIVISPLIEEYAYHKVLLSTLSKYGKAFALICSSFIFALAHGSVKEMLLAFVMSYELGKIYLRYNSVKPCILIHIIFNAFLYFLFVVPTRASVLVSILLMLIYLIVIVLLVLKRFVRIVVKKSKSTNAVILMFLKQAPVIVAMILFIAHSLLSYVLSL